MGKLSKETLLAEIGQGLSPAQIASKHGLSRQGITKRVNALKLTTTSVATLAPVAPVEARSFVATQRNAIDELLDLLTQVKKLNAACADWLTDADDPTKFDIGARSEEIVVTYWHEDGVDDEGHPRLKKKKAPLSRLLKRLEDHGIVTEGAESRHADPRTLILSTVQECRQIITQCKELALMIADARAMETLRESLLSEIAKVSPDVAQQIADAVRRILLLHAAPGGADTASAGTTLAL